MHDYIKSFEQLFDQEWLKKHILDLYSIERKQTFPAYQEAAKYVYDLLCEEGYEAELLNFPADGKTSYQDKISPLGWDITNMKMTVLGNIPELDDPVIADYQREPLSVVKGSVSTPPEGITARLVTESQMLAGEDVEGAFVLLNSATRPWDTVMTMMLDLGALGWVSDFFENPHTTPDSVSWLNAATEHNGWHVIAGDRDFIGFQVPPRTVYALRHACEHRPVAVHVVSDGRRYETVLPAITGLLPGEDPREIWIVSHMYEPLIDDNANGVIGSIEILNALRRLQREGKLKLKYSVRVVFASEYCGFAAVAEHFGGDLSKRTIGGLNTDGLTSSFDKSRNKSYALRFPPDTPGHSCNILLLRAAEQVIECHPEFILEDQGVTYGDDCFIGDPTIGCPTPWLEYVLGGGYHHNSWLDESQFDPDSISPHLAGMAAYVRAMACMDEEEVRQLLPYAVNYANEYLQEFAKHPVRAGTDQKARMQFLYECQCSRIRDLKRWGADASVDAAIRQIVLPESACPEKDAVQDWYKYAENFVFMRKERGFPMNLVKLPKEERKPLPGWILYDYIGDLFCRMDGKKTLCRLIDETEWTRNIILPEKSIAKYIHTLIYLANAGYLYMDEQNLLCADDLTAALQKLGVKEGDTLLVHSALSGLGHLTGGPNAAITALRNAVGSEGTILAPIFARPYATFLGELSKEYAHRPYDTRPSGHLRDKSISTGALPKAMLNEPDAYRSGHATHEWVAIGKEAKVCTEGHGFLDPPAAPNSPMKHALDRGGSVVFLGCGINFNTFLHYVETEFDAPYLSNAAIRYVDKNGKTDMALIHRHLPGHRSFYQGFDGEFYKEAIRRGLVIHEQPFGMATLYRMELSQLYTITKDMLAEDRCALLCKDPGCTFCRKYRI